MLSATKELLKALDEKGRLRVREVLLVAIEEDLLVWLRREYGPSTTTTLESMHSMPFSRHRLQIVKFGLVSFSHFRGPF